MLYMTGADLFGNGYGVQTRRCPAKVSRQRAWNTLSDVADTSSGLPTATIKNLTIHSPVIEGGGGRE